jgi:CBS domain-containing protein
MKVKDLMTIKVISVKLGTPYKEVAKILRQKGLTGVPVVNENDDLVGFVSEKDLFNALYPLYNSYYEHPEEFTDKENRDKRAEALMNEYIDSFMKKNVITVSPDMPILSAGAIMLANHVHKFPVVENNKIVGIISREMIYNKAIEKMVPCKL